MFYWLVVVRTLKFLWLGTCTTIIRNTSSCRLLRISFESGFRKATDDSRRGRSEQRSTPVLACILIANWQVFEVSIQTSILCGLGFSYILPTSFYFRLLPLTRMAHSHTLIVPQMSCFIALKNIQSLLGQVSFNEYHWYILCLFMESVFSQGSELPRRTFYLL